MGTGATAVHNEVRSTSRLVGTRWDGPHRQSKKAWWNKQTTETRMKEQTKLYDSLTVKREVRAGDKQVKTTTAEMSIGVVEDTN